MPIPVPCPGCAARLNAPDAAAGKSVKCPKCKATVAVPAPLTAAEFEVVEDDAPPAPQPRPAKKPVTAIDPEPRKKSRDGDEPQAAKKKQPSRRDDEDDEDDDDRPRKKRGAAANGGSSKVLIGAIAGVLLIAGGGFAVYWFAIREKPADTAGGGTGGTPDDMKPPRDPKVVPGKTVTANWKEFPSPKYSFKVSFPWGDPTERPVFGNLPAGVNNNNATLFRAERWEGDKPTYTFAVTAVRLRPKTNAADRQKAGEVFFEEMPVPKGMRRSEAKPVTWAGRPAGEFVTEPEAASEAGKTERITERLLVTETCIYVGSVRDVGGLTPGEVARFFDGFELLAGTAPKPPDPKLPDPKDPPPASLPPLPSGWVTFNDFRGPDPGRYAGQIPPGGQTTGTHGRLAYLKDVGKGKITAGQYNEVVYPDKGVTVSMRVLVFANDTPPGERAALLEAYAKRLSEAAGVTPTATKVKWANLDATQETLDTPEASQVRRYAVAGPNGFVMTVRGTKRAEFDEWKAVLFDHVLPHVSGATVGPPGIQKGWEELSSDAGLFRVEIPGTPVPAADVNKLLADLKLTGEFQRVESGNSEYFAGYVKLPAKSAAADRKRVRDALVAALKPAGAPDRKPINFPATPRQLAWEEYQWQIAGGRLSGQIRFHESDGILRVVAVRSKDKDEVPSQDRMRFTQSFELLR